MKQENELKYYEETKDWNFDMFEIEAENLTKWDLFEILNKLATKESKILDLGTGGGEKVLKFFPNCKEILATDFSPAMIETARKNLERSDKQNIRFEVMDNLNMYVTDNYFDIVVARNTVTDPKQIYKCLKDGGYLIIHGIDMYDCHNLKLVFGRGQAYNDKKPISVIDYENVINAGFRDAELIPIYEREYFKNSELFKGFLKKVPIIDDFSEETLIHHKEEIDDELLNKYISENTYNGKIRLLRRYYGIIAKK